MDESRTATSVPRRRERPAPQELTSAEIFGEPDTNQNRPPNTVITGPSDLSTHEKATMVDLLVALYRSRVQRSRPVITSEIGIEVGRIVGELDKFRKGGKFKSRRNGQPASFAIRFTSYENMGEAYIACIEKYDDNERERAEENRAFVIAVARRRVVKFAQEGSEYAPVIDPGDRADHIIPPVFTSDLMPAMLDTWVELNGRNRQRQIHFFS
ncbi:hypothetical protein NCS56_00297100 [Fusarium sp. Ph1]|nr:hypothetical protein NCS56_00297100 [Fusarium sp. Ph1]